MNEVVKKFDMLLTEAGYPGAVSGEISDVGGSPLHYVGRVPSAVAIRAYHLLGFSTVCVRCKDLLSGPEGCLVHPTMEIVEDCGRDR